MESYADITPLFDLGQATNFSQLPDDDFLAFLQKQFPNANQGNQFLSGFGDGVNPQNLSQFSFSSSISPTSEDSSPSPPSTNKNDGNKHSPEGQGDEVMESALKRKASDDDFEEGPSQKNQHTASSSTVGRQKGGTTKRKASGADESRLLKRKEQNRAARRAFRERKEKHVRDLEDKVAALEAKNEATTTENENLRDLLSRLQSENMALRQQAQSFTFTVPKSATSTAPPTNEKAPQFLTDNSMFSTLPRISYTAPDPTNYSNPLDMTSMMSFNPSVLNLLDETPQQTATDNATRMDFGFGDHNTPNSNSDNQNNKGNNNGGGSWLPSTSNLTTLTTNPAYFSLASAFSDPSPPPPPAPASNEQSSFNFDINSLTQWPSSTSSDAGTLDDLFGGYFNPTQPMDVDALIRGSPSSSSFSSSMSPVVHHTNMRSPATSASSSPASHASDASLFSGRESSSSESEHGHDEGQCPKTKEEARQKIMSSGASPFVEQANGGKHTYEACTEAIKSAEPSPFVGMSNLDEAQLIKSVACQRGSGFPCTEKNENNVEVLTAWRSITRDPNFKECDITKLCSEFASKARCDGSKVVLEPSGVNSIREALSAKKH